MAANRVTTEVRSFTNSTQLWSKYEDAERRGGSFYHVLWKRKFTWLCVLGGAGTLMYELFRPDRKERKQDMQNSWARLSGGAYDKPQRGTKSEDKSD